MNFISIALLAVMAPAQSAYTAEHARDDLGQIALAQATLMKCERGSEERKKEMVDRSAPRVAALTERFRAAFGSAIPTSFKPKVDMSTCNSRRRYDRDLEYLITRVEGRAAGLPPLTAPAAAAPAAAPKKTGE
ncbi:hypothetical protein P1X14_13800 [Sphingomonas sp. AOB5]|uniref:hypothetical protein n=1 Tax=Sphingomonas sp. AOB5 TaxID=3034017 RepID=UPI0023F81191|nr:hypothetical protein [Sphingomonas sp. AOB5]MDF7776324.1 hypothetical protein [Sphingomonas sp. AOB5]